MSEVAPMNPERSLETERQLEEINNSVVLAKWSEDQGEKVDVTLPHRCSFSGVITTEGSACMTAVYLTVPEALRGNQIGERLTRALTVVAMQRGVTTLRADIESPYALRSWRKVFGDERLRFYHDVPSMHDGELPMSADQAVLSLERAYVPGAGNLEGDVSLDVEVDLFGLDISDWEQPVEASF
jgi:hypothetical protein